MSLIREKATESEAIVRNITRDIQVLDLGKDNLVRSMTMLKRLQMLGVLSLLSEKHIM
jgi:vacuolar protein sorting-associated protein 53